MENEHKSHSELKSKSWSDIFDEFLSSPPTSSIFRLYLLSFCIWNKGVILYIFFGSADMGDKLAFVNWSKFVPFYPYIDSVFFAYLSLYFGPLIVVSIIITLVFGTEEKIPSLYYKIYRAHFHAEEKKLDVKKSVADTKAALINVEIQNEVDQQKLTTIKELTKPKIIAGVENYEESYRKFRKTSYFPYFINRYQKVYYDKKNSFGYNDLTNIFDQKLTEFLFSDKCFSYPKTKELASIETLNGPNHDTLEFNSKGEYYIKYYEWEKGVL